jgi:hypothetical protein
MNLPIIPFHGNFEVGSTTYLDWLIVDMNADWFFGKPTMRQSDERRVLPGSSREGSL